MVTGTLELGLSNTLFVCLFVCLFIQLKLYAKYFETKNINQDNNNHAHAVCDTKLEGEYYKPDDYPVFSFLVVTLVVPLIAITLTATVVRSYRKDIQKKIDKSEHHHNLVGLVLTGIFVSFYIVGCDVMAVGFAFSGKHELSQHELRKTLNIFSTVIILIFDSSVTLIPLVVLSHICCKHINEETCIQCEQQEGRLEQQAQEGGREQEARLDQLAQEGGQPQEDGCEQQAQDSILKYCLIECSCCFDFFFYVIFGTLEDNITDKDNVLWLISFTLVAPIFTISSHFGYILVAWLTNTAQASSMSLIAVAVVVYLIFMLSRCYIANRGINPKYTCISSCLIIFYPFKQCCQIMSTTCHICCCKNNCNADIDELLQTGSNTDAQTDSNTRLNTKAFCVVFIWGCVLVAILGAVIASFTLLPIITYNLLSDLTYTFQILLIVISLLITYKILSSSEPELLRFMRNVKKRFTKHSNNLITDLRNADDDDIKATGYIIGELTKVVIQKLQATEVHE